MGEAWRRARAASYRQQEDRARMTMLRPNLERLWKSTVGGRELVCNAHVPRASIPVGQEAVLLLRGSSPAVIGHGACSIGELDSGSAAMLREAVVDLGQPEEDIGALAVRVERVGEFSDEFAVLFVEDDDVEP